MAARSGSRTCSTLLCEIALRCLLFALNSALYIHCAGGNQYSGTPDVPTHVRPAHVRHYYIVVEHTLLKLLDLSLLPKTTSAVGPSEAVWPPQPTEPTAAQPDVTKRRTRSNSDEALPQRAGERYFRLSNPFSGGPNRCLTRTI